VVWRLTLAAARFTWKFEKERRAGSGLALAGTGCDFYPSLLKPVLTYTFRSRIVEVFFPSTLKPEELARNVSLGWRLS
jgi:hypothetical protein